MAKSATKIIITISITLFSTVIFSQNLEFKDKHLSKLLMRTDCVELDDYVFERGVVYMKDADLDNDGYISTDEANRISTLDIDCNKITSLEGISQFKNLKTLKLSRINLDSIYLMNFPFLESLVISSSNVKDVRIENLANIKDISIGNNQIENLLINNNPNVETIDCSNNRLQFLELSKANNLKVLDCSKNSLTAINTENLINLTSLLCSDNQLKKINLNGNDKIEILECGSNKLENLHLDNLKNLNRLDIGKNSIDKISFVKNKELRYISIGQNSINTIDLSNNKKLKIFNISENNIKNINTIKNLSLKYYYINNCNITRINLTGLDSLLRLNCKNNSITEIDLTTNKLIEELDFSNNQLTKIRFSKNNELVKLLLSNNKLKSLITDSLINIKELDLSFNQLQNISFAPITTLENLNLSNNKLIQIDIAKLSGLKSINLSNNNIESYISPPNLPIKNFNISNNRLKHIDIRTLKELVYLNCSKNLLTNLDLSGLRKIYSVSCEFNHTLLYVNLHNTHYNQKPSPVNLDLENNFALLEICVDDPKHRKYKIKRLGRQVSFVKPKTVKQFTKNTNSEFLEKKHKRSIELRDSFNLLDLENKILKKEKVALNQKIDSLQYSTNKISGSKIKKRIEGNCLKPKQVLFASGSFDNYLWVNGTRILSRDSTCLSPPSGLTKLYASNKDEAGIVDSIEILKPKKFVVEIQADFYRFCKDSITLTTNNFNSNILYSWTLDGRPVGDQHTLKIGKSGTYKVTIANIEGCVASDKITIKDLYDHDDFAIRSTSPDICEGKNVDLKVEIIGWNKETIHSYTWYSSDGIILSNKPTFKITKPDTYKLTVEHVFGCSKSKFITINKCLNTSQNDYPKATYRKYKIEVNRNLKSLFELADQEYLTFKSEENLKLLEATGVPLVNEDGSKTTITSLKRDIISRRKLFNSKYGYGFYIENEFEILNQKDINLGCCQDLEEKEKIRILESYILQNFSQSDYESEAMINSSTESFISAFVVRNDSTYIVNSSLLGYGFLHKINEDQLVAEFTETKDSKNFEHENLEFKNRIPTKVSKFQLSTKDFNTKDPIYGYCELETNPYFVDADLNTPLKLKRKFKFYFKALSLK